MPKNPVLYSRLEEFSHLALEENSNRKGFYLVGVESPKLIYGFDEKDPLVALKILRDKGYGGLVLPFKNLPDEKLESRDRR